MTRKYLNFFDTITKYSTKTVNTDKNDEINTKVKENGFTPPEFLPPEESKSLSYFQLFRYSTKWERILIFIGLILISIGAFGIPYGIIIYGEFASLLVDRTIKTGTSTPTIFLKLCGGGRILINDTNEENRLALIEDSIAYCIACFGGSIIQFIVVLIAIDLINYSALKQISRIRKLFFGSILRQDMTWYDINSHNNNFTSKMTEDLDKLKEGIAEKLGIYTFLMMSVIYSIIVAFIYGWKLTLVVLSGTPIIILSTALVAKVQSSLTEKELKSYSLAGNVAEEVFSSIRTVVAFSGEEKELERYSERLIQAEKTGERKGLFSGLGSGIMWFLVYCCYALALWYGIQLILEDRYSDTREYTPGALVIVLFGVLMAAQNLGLTSPLLEAFSTARGAAASIFSIVDRKSLIDPMNSVGIKLNDVKGNIRFENLSFHYPARKDVEILKGLDLTIESGQTVAFVGSSGCGKSTCLQLFQRLYDPNQGCIQLDGVKINELNVGWLRSQMGLVGQEPVLFATTIGENIRYGNPSASQKDIEHAAEIANCHDFILNLPKGYDTLVGEKGNQMSGGQKQRIAIARAIIRNPKILLLDEATSALDPASERKVQNALEKASKGRTTLVVSHRLSAIINADKIVFINNGVIAEQGTHNELMLKGDLYFNLVNATKQDEETDIEPSTVLDNKHLNRKLKHQNSVISNIGEEKICNLEEETIQEKLNVSMIQLLKLNAPEWMYITIGIIAAILHGSSLPLFAILFGEFFGILSLPDSNLISEGSLMYSYYFIALGVISGVGTLLQFYMFNISGVRLTSRLRKTAFKKIISQEMGWFDEQINSVGALCARLAGDCANVQGATGSRIGSLVQASATLVIGIIISLWYTWSLTLVTMVTIPFVLGSILLESRYIAASTYDEKLAIESSTQVAIEAISNIRTVTSLGQEPYVLERYCNKINDVMLACRNKTKYRGTVFSLGQSAPYAAYGVAFYYGGTLVANEGLEYKNIIKVSEALIFGTWMLAQALAYAPNVNAAIISAGRLLRLFERSPKIHNPTLKPYNTIDKTNGNINYKNVEFHYPTRPETLVLKGINLDIPKGSTVALVGPSGCGKSTCIQLLLRYYDPDSGNINLSDVPTTEFPFDTLRSQLGLVSQEPVLFDRTIAENIAYGDNFRDIAINEIIDAAKKANIHDFITNLPLGYDTSLGNKGAQLSGGQKQRIAIARALVRNPRILILDEATSALDVQSEKIVQEALDAARTGRTCITIAHRLTTIQNADIICVFKRGVIIERGNHEELMKLNGTYSEMYTMQQVH